MIEWWEIEYKARKWLRKAMNCFGIAANEDLRLAWACIDEHTSFNNRLQQDLKQQIEAWLSMHENAYRHQKNPVFWKTKAKNTKKNELKAKKA